MIGLVLVTHGKLAQEFRNALEHVVGPQKNLETVSIGPEDDMDQRRIDIIEAVAAAGSNASAVLAALGVESLAGSWRTILQRLAARMVELLGPETAARLGLQVGIPLDWGLFASRARAEVLRTGAARVTAVRRD